VLKPVVRLFSFFFKELSEVRRQPRLILSLLLGPFLILLLFGVGYQGSIPKFRVALVLPADTSLLPPQMVDELKKAIETNFILVSADANQDEALRKLQNGEVDVVELFPPDVSQVILRVPLGQQSPVVFRYSEVNPQNESWVKYLGYAQVTEINKQILMQIIAQAQKQSNAFPNVSPQAIVSPLEPQYENIRGQSLSFMTFYAPSVMALILQHIALTLGALALVRERLRGSFELFRVAPISINTILVGKYLAYILYVGIIAALLVGALVLMRTPFGRNVYAVGGNAEAARLSGIRVERVQLVVYSICGGCAGLAGILVASRLNAGYPRAGEFYELDAIAAVVVGGTSLFGGRGSIWGTLAGAFFIGVLNNGLNLFRVSTYDQLILKGVVLLAAASLDRWRSA